MVEGFGFTPLKDSQIDVISGGLKHQGTAAQRREKTDGAGSFKFLRLPYDLYSFVAKKDQYYSDYFDFISNGIYTTEVPNLVLLPYYKNSQGSLWIKMKQSESAIDSLLEKVNLQLKFVVGDS